MSEPHMKLDQQMCSRARLARDARFDGKFFIAVLSTGIYCRPICPARTSKEENVRYFASAAAAAEAGFRPCLRCRPECSPGTSAWFGTSGTVSRALRLIGESGLEEGGVEALAAHLGIGSRHLRRLFLKHLGATPTAVAQTRRLHFAKKLIDETSLSMTQIAFAAGFGCVRRFNAAIRKTYARTPTDIRARARRTTALPENEYILRLSYRPPFDWYGMLSFLELRATTGVEAAGADGYRRTISLNGKHGYFEVTPDESNGQLLARVQFPDPTALFSIIERIRAMFDLNADCSTIRTALSNDPDLSARLDAHPGLRVPGCWNGFELAIRTILGQQISVKGATTLAGRIAAEFGETFNAPGHLTRLFPSPRTLAEADLTSVGLTRARAATINALAGAVADGVLSFDRVANTDEFLHRLCEIRGIGRWTAQYIAMRALREPDAFPCGDLALLRELHLNSARELEERAETWRPWRAYATMHLWNETGTRDRPSRALPGSSITIKPPEHSNIARTA